MKAFACRSPFIRLLAALIMVLTMALPVLAQGEDDTIVEDGDLVVVTGTLTFDGDSILVAGYVIAPSSAFIPADYNDGDKVIVTGVLLPDGETIQAISIELFDNGGNECDPEVDEDCPPIDEECDPEVDEDCPPIDEECDPEVDENCPPIDDECDPEVDENCPPIDDECDPEVDENCPPIDEECDPEVDEDCEEEIILPDAPCATAAGHVGQRIADEFEVDVKLVMSMRCDGYGFGEIVIALTLANGDKATLKEIRAMREEGTGWGRLKKMDWSSEDDEEATAERVSKKLLTKGPRADRETGGNGRGNSGGNNGNGGGNGNNGNGNGKDKDKGKP